MANLFSKAIMASETVRPLLVSALFQANNANAPVMDGAIIELGDLVTDTTYAASGDVYYNVYLATAPSAANAAIAIVDYAGISEGAIAGNVYKMGNKLFNLTVPAGTVTRARIPQVHDKFWLGADNFTATPAVGQFASTTANALTLTPNAAAQTGFNVKVLLEKGLTTGQKGNGNIYLCEVVAL